MSIGRASHLAHMAKLWTEHLDRRTTLMQCQRILNEVVNIFCNREWFLCVWINEQIWFVTHCPEFDGMEDSMGIFAYPLSAVWVIHNSLPSDPQDLLGLSLCN